MDRRKAIQRTAFLLGGAVSASIIAGVMSGCQAEKLPDWQPVFLDKDQAFLVGELAETILPETETLGAKSIGVPEYIDIVVKDCFTGDEQLEFKKGLIEIDKQCQLFAGKSFLDCSAEERQKFLVLNETEGIKKRKESDDKAFIITLKELVLTGYFTSEYAITELMNFNPIPQKFEGCIDAPASQKIQVGIEGRSA